MCTLYSFFTKTNIRVHLVRGTTVIFKDEKLLENVVSKCAYMYWLHDVLRWHLILINKNSVTCEWRGDEK